MRIIIKSNWRSCASFLLLLLSFICTSAYAKDSIISQASELQRAGKFQQAYELMQSQADDHAGVLEFDYLLGTVAIDAGHPLQAVFALERVLDQSPDFAPARAELARAYFLIGENETAKAEFERAQKSDMPAESKEVIKRYISSIDERILGSYSQSTFYISAGLGYDSNVNSATDTSQIAVPTGTLTLLAPEADSSVGLLQGGGQFSHALKQNINLYGSADIRLYEAFDESDFSTQIADAVLGLHFLQGLNQYRISMVGQLFAVDASANRNLLGLNTQWQRTIDAANQFTLFGQFAGIRYPDASRLDVNQLSIGATWLHVYAGASQPITYITGYYGSEDEQTDVAGSDFIGRYYYGVRAGVRFKTSARLVWSGVVSYQHSKYGGVQPLFGETRKDNFYNIIAGADYLYANNWSVRPEIIYSNNDSNLELNSYDRLRALITARKEF